MSLYTCNLIILAVASSINCRLVCKKKGKYLCCIPLSISLWLIRCHAWWRLVVRQKFTVHRTAVLFSHFWATVLKPGQIFAVPPLLAKKRSDIVPATDVDVQGRKAWWLGGSAQIRSPAWTVAGLGGASSAVLRTCKVEVIWLLLDN